MKENNYLIARISTVIPGVTLWTFVIVFGSWMFGGRDNSSFHRSWGIRCCDSINSFFHSSWGIRCCDNMNVFFAMAQETDLVILTKSWLLIAIVANESVCNGTLDTLVGWRSIVSQTPGLTRLLLWSSFSGHVFALDIANVRLRADGMLENNSLVHLKISSAVGRWGDAEPISPAIDASSSCIRFLGCSSSSKSTFRTKAHNSFRPVANHRIWIVHRGRLACFFNLFNTTPSFYTLIKQVTTGRMWAILSSWIATILNYGFLCSNRCSCCLPRSREWLGWGWSWFRGSYCSRINVNWFSRFHFT